MVFLGSYIAEASTEARFSSRRVIVDFHARHPARRASRAMVKEGAIVLYRASSRDSPRLLAGKKPAGAHTTRIASKPRK